MMELRTGWQLARDPKNCGKRERWYADVRTEAQPAPVPGIIQQVFPDYHGVAWYWCIFRMPPAVSGHTRTVVRFGAVDYFAEVWVNGKPVGRHEGGETAFELDVTAAVHARGDNLLAVRVVNPAHERIDGMVLNEIPHRNKAVPHTCGSSYNYGGLMLPVELWQVPALRVTDIVAVPDRKTGIVKVTVTVRNDTRRDAACPLTAAVEPQHAGEVVVRAETAIGCPRGESTHRIQLRVPQVHEWSLDDPFLYRLTAGAGMHQASVRIGFREFRVEDGWFTLNGKRLFLKSTHTGNHMPIGQVVPPNPDLMRRDLLYAKACGYNCVRFIAGVAWPEQLDYCDEIGLMVYEESLAGWCLADSPDMKRRFDAATRDMVCRDRNHPSVTIWGLLNETFDGPVFRHAVGALKLVRDLDATRLVLLASGRWDCQWSIGSVCNPGSRAWEHQWGREAPGAVAAPSAWHPFAGGYFAGAGDAHVYPGVPQTAVVDQFIRTLGKDTKPVLLSEYGIGSLMNVIGELRKYEEAGTAPDVPDMAFMRRITARLQEDWQRWDMGSAYPFPEDMLRDSQRRHMRQRRLGFDLIRSNPQLCGFNLTGMLDHGLTGEGMWTFWRDLKPLAADTLRDGWAPLRWCLFVTPAPVYAGRAFDVEAVLATEDVLPPGRYPVRFRIHGDAGTVWETAAKVVIPQPAAGERAPLAVPVLKKRITLDVPPGTYTLAACLERGGCPAGDRTTFHVASAAELPQLKGSVALWGIDARVARWLQARGLTTRSGKTTAQMTPDTLILVGNPADADNRSNWLVLAKHVARGGVAVFLEPAVFAQGKESTVHLPLAQRGECRQFHDWLYHKECVARRHPVFAGLQAGGILDWELYGPVISRSLFSGQEPPVDVACAAFAAGTCASGYDSGIMLGAWRLGHGHLVLNTLNILANIDQQPAADRLLCNLVTYAQGLCRRRPAALPAGFQKQLDTVLFPPCTAGDFLADWQLSTSALPEQPIAGLALAKSANLAWRQLPTPQQPPGFVNFHALDGACGGIVFARTQITVPRDMMCDLLLGTDGPAKVWLGDTPVATILNATNPATPDKEAFPVSLRKGQHTLTVAFHRRGGAAWGFFVRFRRSDPNFTAAELASGQVLLPRGG